MKEKIIIFSIILIFVILLLPSLRKRTPGCGKTKIQSQICAIKTAIMQYESQYGFLPWEKGNDKLFSEYNCCYDYDILFELLTCKDSPDPDNEVTYNIRKTRFFTDIKDFKINSYKDQWGNRFKIFLDTNYDMKVNVNGKILDGKIFIYSFGKNQKDDFGKEDDEISWE